MYGRMETYDFKLLRSGPLPTNSRYQINIDNYDYTQTDEADEQGYAIHRITIDRGGAQPYAVEIEAYYGGYLSASVTIGRNESSASFTVDSRMGLGNLTFKGYVDGSELQRRLAHAYPLCPDEVRGQEWEQSPIFAVNDLLIKKNSAERLIFAAQYHFQRDIRDFIISRYVGQMERRGAERRRERAFERTSKNEAIRRGGTRRFSFERWRGCSCFVRENRRRGNLPREPYKDG